MKIRTESWLFHLPSPGSAAHYATSSKDRTLAVLRRFRLLVVPCTSV